MIVFIATSLLIEMRICLAGEMLFQPNISQVEFKLKAMQHVDNAWGNMGRFEDVPHRTIDICFFAMTGKTNLSVLEPPES